jgi:hypothetical protein
MVAQAIHGQQAVGDSLANNVAQADTISPEADLGIDNVIEYFGKDSTVTDVDAKRIRLYGEAWVKYGDLEVKAPYIEFSFDTYIAKAGGLPDSTGKKVGKATFKQADTEFTEDSLAYNFKTKKGMSYGARTQEGDAYLIAGVSKKQENDWVNIKNGMLTTCDKEHPHYHFKLSKAIVVPNEKVVSGPLYMKVGKVPTPLALPFGFFPNKKESSQGILLPGYGNAQSRGFFLQNLGYYLPINQYLDTKMLFDVYSRGSWVVRNVTNYKRLYKYNGSFNISRSVSKDGFRELPSYSQVNTFNVRWNHTQDAKAKPNTTFNASVNLGSNQNFRNNLNSTQNDFLSSTFQSAVQYGKSWAGTPFSMALSMNHTQNTQTKNVQVTLPSATFTMSRVNLFKNVFRKNPIGLNWSANAENYVSAGDTMFRLDRMTQLARSATNGVRHQAGLSTSLKMLRGALTFNPSANATWYWTFRQLQAVNTEEENVQRLDTVFRFAQALNWSASATFNTRIYGTFVFRKAERLKAIRHMIQPSVGWGYTPYQNFDETGFYDRDGNLISYSRWDIARFQPTSTTGPAGSLNFGLNQNFEAKIRDKSSAKVAYKKVKLIDNFRTSASYNMMADSMKWSNINFNAFTTISKGVTVRYNSTYSLYAQDENGRSTGSFLMDKEGRLMRMVGTTVSGEFSLSGGNGKAQPAPQTTSYSTITQEADQMAAQNPSSFVNFSVPWTLRANYNLTLTPSWNRVERRDTIGITQAVTFSGSVTILKRWALSFDSGYNFKQKEWTTTSIGLNWDLHCWEFKASVVPFGARRSYMVQLNVKSALLRDLKLQRRGTLGEDGGFLY